MLWFVKSNKDKIGNQWVSVISAIELYFSWSKYYKQML